MSMRRAKTSVTQRCRVVVWFIVLFLALFFTGCSNIIPSDLIPKDLFSFNRSSDISISLTGIAAWNKSDGTPLILIENPSACDIGYTGLIEFLATFKPEVLPSKTCGHYAEELHNYSENQGIRCAIVIIKFAGSESGHAFNGFFADGKMVYVDAGDGIISIARKAIWPYSGLEFVKRRGILFNTLQEVGQEKDFLIFWR